MAASGGQAQIDHQIVHAAEMPGVTGDGSSCNPWTSPSGTGGIAEALAACLPGSKGCKILLPKGFVRVTSTIDTFFVISRRDGLVIQGHGSGEKFVVPATGDSFAGTVLRWWSADIGACAPSGPYAPADGTVFKVTATSFSRFEDFAIDGGGTLSNGTAGIGLEVTNPPASNGISIQNLFENIAIRDINGEPGIGLLVGPPVGTNYQTSESLFSHLFISETNTAVLQRGQQTTNIRFRDLTIGEYRDIGMDFEGGTVQTYNVVFSPTEGGLADVRVQPSALWALFENNYHEVDNGAAYLFPESLARVYPTTLLGVRVQWAREGGEIIDYRQAGALNLLGCNFDVLDSPHYGSVFIDAPTGGQANAITSWGNFWEYSPSGGTRMVIDPSSLTSLIANDNPTRLSGPIYANGVHTLYREGVIYEGGSQNWRDVGASTNSFTQYLNSTVLKLRNSTEDIAYWTQGGTLHLLKAAGALEYQGNPGGGFTRLQAIDPGASTATLNLPPVTGTLLAGNSTAGQVLCGHVAVDPPAIANGAAATVSVSTSVALAANDACTCSPRSDWDDKILLKYCSAGASTLQVRLYSANPSGSAIDAGSQTVDFCCLRK